MKRLRACSLIIPGLVGLVSAGCQKEGLVLQEPVVSASRPIDAKAVVGPLEFYRQDFLLDAERNRYRPMEDLSATWMKKDRFAELYRQYLSRRKVFGQVLTALPADPNEVYFLLRPRVTLKQYARLSLSGTVLTVGTGLLYNFLGGSAMYRYVDCEVEVSVETASGRHVATYVSSRQSPEELATEGPDQLGRLVSAAYTDALQDGAGRLSLDRELLDGALSADLRNKGVIPLGKARIEVVSPSPKCVTVQADPARIMGKVTGLDRPAVLEGGVQGLPARTIPLKDSPRAGEKEFSFEASLPEGEAVLVLRLRGAGDGAEANELARTELGFYRVPARAALPIGRRWAVVVGISQYQFAGKGIEPLRYASRDAAEFCQLLTSPAGGGFAEDHVLFLSDANATAVNVRKALFEFLARPAKEDLVVIFLSGHGMSQAGTENFFLVCHDTDPASLPSTGFPMWDIETALDRYIRAERVVVFADACHAGGIRLPAGAKAAADNAVHQYLQQLAVARPGRLVFTSCGRRELSFESEKLAGGRGVFAHFLLEGLRGAADENTDGLVTADELIRFVRARVIAATEDQQHPEASGRYDAGLPLGVVQRR